MSAIDKYNARVDAADSLVCVGLDSDAPKAAGRLPRT